MTGLKPSKKNPYEDNPYEDAPSDQGSSDYGPIEAAANGMLGGFAGEIQAGIRSHAPDWMRGPGAKEHGTYSEELAKANRGEEVYAQDHKWTNRALEAAGMLASGALAGGASAAGRIASNVGIGALYGAGSAKEGAGNRAKGALFGGAVGGAGGALFEHLAGPIAEAIPGVSKLGRKVGLLPSVEEKADRYIAGRFKQDNLDMPGARSEVLSRPDTKPEIMVDIGGRNVLGATRRAVNTPGEAADQFENFVQKRGANASGRASDDLTSVGLNPVNRYETADQLIAAQKANAKPLYDKIRVQVVNDPELNALIEKYPALQVAKAKAESMGEDAALATELRGGQAPGVPSGPGITGEVLHRMKLGLDDMVKYGYVPSGGSASHKNFASKDVAAAFRERLGKVLPGYDQAAGQFAGDQAVKDAFKEGSQALRSEGAKSAYEISQMTPSQKQAYKMGAGANLRTAADKVGDKGNVETTLLGNDFKRKQVGAILDNPADYEKFAGEMSREGKMSKVNNLQGGSQTAPLLAEGADAAKILGGIGHAATSPLRAGVEALVNRLQGISPEMNQAIGKRLMSGSVGGRAELLSGLQAIEKAGLPKTLKARYIAHLIAATGGNVFGGSVR